jgi:hypothetical protein
MAGVPVEGIEKQSGAVIPVRSSISVCKNFAAVAWRVQPECTMTALERSILLLAAPVMLTDAAASIRVITIKVDF